MRSAGPTVARRLRRGSGALVLALATLAGCGSGGGTDPAATPSTSVGTVTAAADADPPGSTASSAGASVPSAVASTFGTSGAVTGLPSTVSGCTPGRSGPPDAAVGAAWPALRAICRDLWLDPGYGAADEPEVVAAVERAARRVLEAFAREVADPPIVVLCRTPGCIRQFAGSDGRNMTLYPGARAPDGGFVAGLRTVTVVTAPTLTWLEEILAHEFSHHALYGWLGGRLDRVPPWFNEGLATLVGHVPTCSPTPASPVSIAALADQYQWNRYTAEHPDLALAVYCAAARELDAWLAIHGRAGLLTLIDEVATGLAFADRYGPLLLDRATPALARVP